MSDASGTPLASPPTTPSASPPATPSASPPATLSASPPATREYPPASASMYERESLKSMVLLFDEQRDKLLRGRAPNSKLAELSQQHVEEYINLVLGGTSPGCKHSIEEDEAHEDLFRDPECTLYQDIDSALIFRQNFPWKGPYDILTTFAEKKSLTGYLHAHVKFAGEEELQYRDPGGDPNIFLAVCGPSGRHRIHLMLPDFHNGGDENAESDGIDELYPDVYGALYDTVRNIMPEVLSSWHPSYDAEVYRTAQFSNRPTRSESRKCVPEDAGRAFADDFMDRIREKPWGLNAYWFIQIRGMKDDTRYAGELTDAIIDRTLENVIRTQSVIFLDVGLELHLPEEWACMPARGVELHPRLAQIVWGIDEEREWDYTKYEVDAWAGLIDIAGFRCNFAEAPMTANRISYIQVYSSDKFATYNSSSSTRKAVQIHPQQILKMKSSENVPDNIMKIYEVTARNQMAKTLTVTRMEARVPLTSAKRVYNPDLTPSALALCMHAIPVTVIWAWRLHRILACYFFFRYAAAVKHSSRKDPNYLTLLVIVTYLFNTVHSRPGQFAKEREMMSLVLGKDTLASNKAAVRDRGLWAPRRPTEEVLYMDHGALWLPEIQYPCDTQTDVLRLSYRDHTLSWNAIASFFNMKWNDIRDRFTAEYRKDPYASGHLQPKRVKKSDDPIDRVIALPRGYRDFSFKLNDDEYFDHADDLPPEAMIGSAPDTTPMNASLFFVGICSQILQRIGNVGGSGMRLSRIRDEDWLRIKLETFSDMNLSTYFHAYQYERVSTAAKWKKVRSMLFPDADDDVCVLGRSQGWHLVPLYVRYRGMRDVADPTFHNLKNFCWKLFDSLHWFPLLQKDRIVRNEPRTGKDWISVPKGARRAVPVILNPKFRVRVTGFPGRPPVLDPVAVELDEEVEELRRNHDEGMDPILRELWAGISDDEEALPQLGRHPPQHVVAYATEKGRRRLGGRKLVNPWDVSV